MRFGATLLAALFVSFMAMAQETITVTDASINAGETVTWTANNTYVLNGFVFVEEGATLNIEAGTVIKAVEGEANGDNASALIITRGATINAQGTADNPIIFTAQSDDLNDPNDLTTKSEDRGLWGGVIILGRATINDPAGEIPIEGIPSTEARGLFGGNDDTDNSGTFRYVSIRHGGRNIGAGNEINGLTLGAVGSGTTIEYIEVWANADDGYEWFGGTVNAKYLVAAFCGDDSFDYDVGYRGTNQFVFTIQDTDSAGRFGEHDGGDECETCEPYATPSFVNATYIGGGVGNFVDSADTGLVFRDNAGGFYTNSIFTDYNGSDGGAGLSIEDTDLEQDSRARMEAGQLALVNNIWWDFGNGNTIEGITSQAYAQQHLLANANTIVNPMLTGISRDQDGGLDPRPAVGSPAMNAAVAVNGFEATTYVGAFDPSQPLWTNGWTALSQFGYTPAAPSTGDTIMVTDDSINAGETVTWTANNTYVLNGFVFVEEGATLNIEAGTVIKAVEGEANGDNASALIITRGATINAQGTASNPIIFTAQSDDVNDPNDLSTKAEDRGLWGGVIILGRATINDPAGEIPIEGIPSTEVRGLFGGDNDADNSGTLRYVSIRHGGRNIGAGNEINGLTMGAVGSGTTVEYIEVLANADDGYEWFGGTVNAKYLVAAFCGDDSYDYDVGYRGKNQFVFTIQDTDSAGRFGEHDGGDECETCEPYATPTFVNATYIGGGVENFVDSADTGLVFRDNAGGFYTNSIFTDYNGSDGGAGLSIEDTDLEQDSRARMEAGQLALVNNLWWDFGNGNTIEGITSQDYAQQHLLDNQNQIVNPMLRGIDRTPGSKGLDPRPMGNSPAASGATAVNDNFFTATNYMGAFDPSAPLWTDGWTAISQLGYTSDTVVVADSDRYISHVTALGTGSFQTRVYLTNTASNDASVVLQPYAVDGSNLTAIAVNVAANENFSMLSANLFSGENVSHFSIHGPESVQVTVGYSAEAGDTAEAQVNESTETSMMFSFIPNQNPAFFDGIAIVNRGDAAADVTVMAFDANGTMVANDTVATGLAPNAKALAVFNSIVPADAALVKVMSTQEASAVVLRGTLGAQALNVFFQVVPF